MKVRVFQLARELKISSDALVNIITSLGAEVKSHMSSVEDDLVVRIREKIAEERLAVKRETEKKAHMHEEIQKKSEEEMMKLIRGGVTTVFVSHNLQVVQEICHRVLWLDHGELAAEGEPAEVIKKYREPGAVHALSSR